MSSIGLGCMGTSEFYGKGDDEESVKNFHLTINDVLPKEEPELLEKIAPRYAAKGLRYLEIAMNSLNR